MTSAPAGSVGGEGIQGGGGHAAPRLGAAWARLGCRRWQDRWRASRSSRSACGSPGRRRPAMLGDWGADVVKIEPPERRPVPRAARRRSAPTASSPPFELDNRNKRSVGLNLVARRGPGASPPSSSTGADVFVTNARPAALARAGPRLRDRRRRATRASSTPTSPATASTGDERDRAAYDVGAFWSRAGVAAALTPDGSPLPYQRGGMGDHMAGHGRRRRRRRGRSSPASAPARASSCRRRCCASACTCSAGTSTCRCASACRRCR